MLTCDILMHTTDVNKALSRITKTKPGKTRKTTVNTTKEKKKEKDRFGTKGITK